MSRTNPLWGAPPIHGELLTLGIDVSTSHGREVHGRSRQTGVAELAHVPGESHPTDRGCGFLRPWDDVQGGAIGARTLTLRNMSDQIERVGNLWADMRTRKRS